jgi:class III poly(R)-hydroxyalkanoic acid synthase PhaE subunit
MNDSTSSPPEAPIYLKAWDDYVSACQTLFEQLSDPAAAAGGAAMPLAFLGSWKDFAASLGMRADAVAGENSNPEDKFASLFPALGYSREYQEIARRMLELTGQFQRRYAEFLQHSADIGQSAFQATQRRASKDDTLLASPAAIYDAWIDCAEEAYAQAAHGEPFARLLADLCNILSEFKIERGKLLEALARQFDWPSRAEVDSLHRQVGILRSAAVRANGAAAAKGLARRRTGAKEGTAAKPAKPAKPATPATPAEASTVAKAMKPKGVAKATAAAKSAMGPKRRGKRKIRKTARRADR